MRLKLVIASVFLASCSNLTTPTLPSVTPYRIEVRQGNLVTPEMREKIKVGMTTLQVRAALGTPLLIDPFHPNRWDYQYRYELDGKLIRQQRLTLYFENDLLTRIDESEMPPEKK
jgi:outer membrane protein assembly factor BamE